MRQNPERRAALIDAAIEVLAREGARGLTFRAVDKQAAVPVGTASNYFASRDDLMTQIGGRVYERLQPDAATIARSLQGPRDRRRVTEFMQELVGRAGAFRSGYLALFELRLEATRRPDLREVLTRTIRADVEANIAYHLDSGLPGDATTVVTLYLAMNWLIAERLTLPEVFPETDVEALIASVVERVLPPDEGAASR
ncbi:TetR/AcrR family transcriptional regulator [Actinoallomurus rhizosphaericola]|uniref:TetR/AcrR family transcriptional regulator n=1 Tax=Actinoallomurus rhizosphaericola TaxID=2952536 RepID=UPI002090C106|nr:TetR/AcrR family transcriptional regulator [Actinoallomurus rhizosphaericola]MCO5994032.1 TetR family transcriptional regulator [Actinoallomurus rhizosphaericola]